MIFYRDDAGVLHNNLKQETAFPPGLTRQNVDHALETVLNSGFSALSLLNVLQRDFPTYFAQFKAGLVSTQGFDAKAMLYAFSHVDPQAFVEVLNTLQSYNQTVHDMTQRYLHSVKNGSVVVYPHGDNPKVEVLTFHDAWERMKNDRSYSTKEGSQYQQQAFLFDLASYTAVHAEDWTFKSLANPTVYDEEETKRLLDESARQSVPAPKVYAFMWREYGIDTLRPYLQTVPSESDVEIGSYSECALLAADFYERCAEHPDLIESISPKTEDVWLAIHYKSGHTTEIIFRQATPADIEKEKNTHAV